jgi:hypothetical protein
MTMNRRTLFQGALAGAAVPALARVSPSPARLLRRCPDS